MVKEARCPACKGKRRSGVTPSPAVNAREIRGTMTGRHTTVVQADLKERGVDLDFDALRWALADARPRPEEAAFPLIATVDGKRYELYSDGTFDEAELDEGPNAV
jgi:hypothetical protein